MDNKNLEVLINGLLQMIFVNKQVRWDDNVKAAIITAASKMAIPGGIVEENTVVDVLSKDMSDQAKSMIGMGPQYVKQIIGYSVDFNDASAALQEYTTIKDEYDALYLYIKALKLNHEKQI